MRDREIDKILLDENQEATPTTKSNLSKSKFKKTLLKAFSQSENNPFGKMVSFKTKDVEELNQKLLMQTKQIEKPMEESK